MRQARQHKTAQTFGAIDVVEQWLLPRQRGGRALQMIICCAAIRGEFLRLMAASAMRCRTFVASAADTSSLVHVGYWAATRLGCSYAASSSPCQGLDEVLAAEWPSSVSAQPRRARRTHRRRIGGGCCRIDDYAEAKASLDLHLDTLHGHQAGDPDKTWCC